ncbi:sensor histidine kinase [Bifidobacterium leontopitheci]|uniref:Signal transduction histidine kinase-like protein n=1 Tax=Bifidobacterium leontopitheci TaxID=2650774 RepID=A0A6I1GLG9_9BIFI|nr:hypothetical protein [Bifidobacterium leontopitheci]KAB7790259.1 signal transduction histidine kinase-like protein [Bifidobacterium leontopitheci]
MAEYTARIAHVFRCLAQRIDAATAAWPRARIVIAVVAEILFAVEWWETVPVGLPGTLICCCLVASILLLPFKPALTEALAIMLDVVSSVMARDAATPTGTTAMLFALGFIAYDYGVRPAAATYAVIAVQQISLAFRWIPVRYPPSVNESAVIMLVYALAALAGFGVRWRESAQASSAKEQANMQRLMMLRHDARTAAELHDGLTGELSLIARTAQQAMAEENDPDKVELWRQIDGYARQALRQSHDIIDRLYGKPRRPSRDVQADTMTLQEILDRHDGELQAAGLDGHALLQVGAHDNAANDRDMSLYGGLINEIYANVSRYAASSYEISIVWSSRGLEITEINDLRRGMTDGAVPDTTGMDELEATDLLLESGSGLRHYRQMVEQRGGRFLVSTEHGMWTMFVLIPPLR